MKRSDKPKADNVLEVTRSIGCLQLDLISTVAPSHLIILWCGLGVFDTSELDRLLWSEKKLFEYRAHQASIALMDDYLLYNYMMREYRASIFSGLVITQLLVT